MAPPTGNVKNSGAVHLSCIAVLSNPRRCGAGPNNLALDLHLLLGSSGPSVTAHRSRPDFGLQFPVPKICHSP